MSQRSFSQNFRKRRYRVSFVRRMRSDRYGECDNPDLPNKGIRFSARVPERKFLKVALDEAIHACLWDLDNDSVDEIARDIAAFLHRLGFRRIRTEKADGQTNR